MSAAIQGIYIALFGRPADPGGLAYWTEVTKGGTDLSAMLSVLPNLTEYTARFEGQTPDQVITTVYQNLFGRAPDAEGLAFFKGQLASGAQTLATIAVNIMQGAQGDDKADVTAKVDAAVLFTASLDTPEEIAAYSGADAAALAKKFLDGVDKDKPATPESVEKAAGAVVAGQDPTGGQAPGGGGGGGGGTPAPVDVGVERFGQVSNVAQDESNLWVGSGNSVDNFEITTTSISQVELGLKGYVRGSGDAIHDVGFYKFTGSQKAGFAFSVASLGDKTLAQLMEDGYSFRLRVDADKSAGAFQSDATTVFTLEAQKDAVVGQDSGYNWVRDVGGPIVDDEGSSGRVTQNIQSPAWYGAEHGGEILARGEYLVALDLLKGGSVVATEQITLDVDSHVLLAAGNTSLADIATDNGNMLNGSGNSANGFSVVHIDHDKNNTAEFEIAIGAQKRFGDVVNLVDGVFKFDTGAATDVNGEQHNVPTFKFSIASLDADVKLSDYLKEYKIVLSVDQDATKGTDFIRLTAVADPTKTDGITWSAGTAGSLTDDQGTEFVSQNIQALGWYQHPYFGNDAESAEGIYTVKIEVFDKYSELVGVNSVVFDIG